MKVLAEYIWLDGYDPQELRSKTKVLDVNAATMLKDAPPNWGFDGSSTKQAEGHFSDCMLRPVFWCRDPLSESGIGMPNMLVLCEVGTPDGQPHPSNTRSRMAKTAEKYVSRKAWFGFEQEYTLFTPDGRPLGWPKSGFPEPQGRSYCGVGAGKVAGRKIVREHARACIRAGLGLFGTNAEVMLGQWEFQTSAMTAPSAADHLWVMRWLLERIAEDHGVVVSYAPKPVAGDWNGAGGHTNFSTADMRGPGGLKHIQAAIKRLKPRHKDHIKVYGKGNKKRLTGLHETCSINEFRAGLGNRGASVRIPTPMPTGSKEASYLEDRRPAANFDPYLVATALLETICGNGFKVKK